jgi:hypothetical protein
MDLSVFIVQSLEGIVAEWEAFARAQLPAAARLPDEVLRNHVADILKAVAADIAAPQEPDEQTYKSKGQRPDPCARPDRSRTQAWSGASRGRLHHQPNGGGVPIIASQRAPPLARQP